MKYLFLLLFITLPLLTIGQLDYTIQPSVSFADSVADADHFIAHAMIKNLSNETIVIAWQRINNDIPAGWQSYICSNITCAPPDVSMGTFSLTANDSTNLDCYFQPEGNPGSASVELRLFLTNDTTQVIHATYHGNASPVSNLEVFDNKIKVFPNPVTTELYVDYEDIIDLELYTITGALIKTYSEAQQINVQSLIPGGYFLKMYNKDKKLISVTRFQKIYSQ